MIACLVAMLVILHSTYVEADALGVDVIEMNVGTGTDSGAVEMDDAADDGEAVADLVVEDASMASIFTAGNKSKAKPAKARITSLKKSAVNGVNTVTIEWNRAKNATHYRIYYKEAGSGSWKLLKTFGKAKTKGTISSTDAKPLADGKTYLFTVRSYNSVSKKWGLWDKTGSKVTFADKNVVKVRQVKIARNDDAVNRTYPYGLSYGSFKLKTEIYPSNATDKSLRWTSSNTAVATVSSDGTVTMKAGGETLIRVYANGGDARDSYRVKVIDEVQSAQKIIELTNQERIKAGEKPQTSSVKLNEFAMMRAKELSVKYSHYHPDGTYEEFGGNIAYAPGEIDNIENDLVQMWMNSPGHRAAIMADNYFTGVGIYIDGSTVYAAQYFNYSDPSNPHLVIEFDCNGGTGPDKMYAYHNQIIYQEELPIPERNGFKFKGWAIYKRAIFKTLRMNESFDHIVLTAMWEEI